MKALYYLLALLGGIALSMEGAIGSTLGETIGELESSYYIFLTGSIILGLVTFFFGKGSLTKTKEVPKWQLTGGLLGITYLTLIIMVVPYVGVGIAMVSVIVGQMVTSMIIEHFGWLGSKQTKISKHRMLSIFCMIIAIAFIY